MLIRPETPSDFKSISTVTIAAFADCVHGNHTEQFIIVALRKAGALTVSLVAEIEGGIVGHIAFSPVSLSDGSRDWYGLGPISVLPEFQNKGIGKALMHEGLSRLKALGARGCVLVGEPAYYERFGFSNVPELTLDGVPPEYFLAVRFGDNTNHGAVTFHEGFLAES